MGPKARKLTRVVFLGALAAGGVMYVRSCMGSEVYKGNIDGYAVTYEEGRFHFGRPDQTKLTRNVMTMQKGEITYRFEDTTGETRIDWMKQQKPEFERDTLESVLVTKKGVAREFASPQRKEGEEAPVPATLEDQCALDILREANTRYNSIRAKIRDELRNKYEADHKAFVESLK